MERYYDLNGRDKCVTAVITVSDQAFRISRVVIAVRVLYSNHLTEMGKLLERLAALKKDSAGNDEEKALIAEAEGFGKRKMDLYERLIRLLLEKNGYSYDKAWWDENTDEVDRRSFIEKCLLKDGDASGDKKKDKTGK